MHKSRIPPTIAIDQEPAGLIVRMVDQTLLPGATKMLELRSVDAVCEAIKSLRIRGAPAIGCAAAAGVALCACRSEAGTEAAFMGQLEDSIERLAATRPTAVNLFWALERMRKAIARNRSLPRPRLAEALALEARKVVADDLARCHAIGRYGAKLIGPDWKILTHCNAGALATGGYGTALGVIRAAHEARRVNQVWVDETRPLLQGARLTAWELQQEGIECVVITDSMAASVMAQGAVDAVIVGADRISSNGDIANKIGTYGLAVLARYHRIPFYVAAPVTTVDYQLESGHAIPIEQRGAQEITHLAGHSTYPIVPVGVPVHNPAFDVTPSELVSAIITDRGVARSPYSETLAAYEELD